MKKLILILSFVLLCVIGYGQATPALHVRIQNATTPFSINISVGSEVWDIANQKLYKCTAAAASTLTLTTGSADFIQIAGGGTWATLSNGNGINSLSYNGTAGATVSVDTTNIETKTDVNSKLNLKATKADTANQVRVWKYDNAGDIYVGTGNNAYAAIAGNGTATKKFLSETSGTGSFVTISASDVGAQAAFTSDVVDYEATADSLTTCHVAINGAPIGAITVVMNGQPLKLSTQFIIQASPNRVRVSGVPVYQWDKIEITYKY